MKPIATAILSFLTMGLFTSCTVTNIYLVRHAEKADATNASPLSPKGQRRALALRDTLIGKGIDSIYSTDYIRTQETARPLAEALTKEIITYAPGKPFSATLKKLRGKNVLVVGHTNTIPEIIKSITTKNIIIGEDDFDHLYIIRIKRLLNLNISLETTTYGEPSVKQ